MQSNLVDGKSVPGREGLASRGARFAELHLPRRVARPRAGHTGLVDSLDPIALQHQDQAGDVVLVRMGEHDRVDSTVPRREPLVERDQQAPRVRTAIDQQPAPEAALDEDRVTLPHVEGDDPGEPVGAVSHREPETRDRNRQGARGKANRAGGPRAVPRLVPRTVLRRAVPCRGRRGAPRPGRRSARSANPASPAHRTDHERSRCGSSGPIPGRRQLQARERHARASPDGCDDQAVQRPGREPGERGHDRGHTGQDQQPAAEGHGAGRHRRRHERHHDEVHERRDDGQAAEVEQHDRQRRDLRGERDPEDLGEPVPWPARRIAGEAPGPRRPPGDDPGRGERRQPEPGVVDPRGISEQQERDRPAERRGRRPGPAQLAGQEGDAGHRRRSDDRRRGADERDVRDDRDRRQGGSSPSLHAPRDRGQRRGHDRDVPAGDRHDVARAGSREIGCERPIDTIPETDQHARGEAGLWFRDGQRESVGGGPAQVLEPPRGSFVRRQQLERVNVQRARDPDPREVVPVGSLRRLTGPAGDRDPVARADRRKPRQRRGKTEVRLCLEAKDGRPAPGPRSGDRFDDAHPRPPALWKVDVRHRCRRCQAPRAEQGESQPERDEAEPEQPA